MQHYRNCPIENASLQDTWLATSFALATRSDLSWELLIMIECEIVMPKKHLPIELFWVNHLTLISDWPDLDIEVWSWIVYCGAALYWVHYCQKDADKMVHSDRVSPWHRLPYPYCNWHTALNQSEARQYCSKQDIFQRWVRMTYHDIGDWTVSPGCTNLSADGNWGTAAYQETFWRI